MREAGVSGEILPWRDVLHDGPVPAGLGLSELSRMRASYLAASGPGEAGRISDDFARRDAVLLRFPEYDPVTLWFEWDLYDQLQLIQILDFLSRSSDAQAGDSTLEIVSVAGYLGTLPANAFAALYERRLPVTHEILLLGESAWRAFTSSNPHAVVTLRATDTSSLPFLGAALERLLEELPSIRDGLARSERQLLQGIADGQDQFRGLFQDFSSREERMYCGDSSAASYLERLSRGTEPLVLSQSGERISAPRNPADVAAFQDAALVLTDAGRAVLAGDRDWIEIGGSDRWLGGMHLEGSNTAWRWDPDTHSVTDARTA